MKNINYINKTFDDFKQNLKKFAQSYFPQTYNDFSEASPGDMFFELSSYVGDVLSFRVDNSIQENFALLAQDKDNLRNMSYIYGYIPKLSYSSNTLLDIYQIIPNVGGNIDPLYSLFIPSGTKISSTFHSITFLTVDDVDFSDTSDASITYYNDNYFMIKKSVNVISAEIKTVVLNFDTPTKFAKSTITDDNILQIISVIDDENEKWYEVPSLGQEYVEIPNDNTNDDRVKKVLTYQACPRRFVTRIESDNQLSLFFGSGISSYNDDELTPNPENIQLGLIPSLNVDYTKYNQINQFFTKSYGLAPSSNLTVQYTVGGGISSNISSNTLNVIDKNNIIFKFNPLDDSIKTNILSTIYINNEYSSKGGRDGDDVEDLRLNMIHAFQAQERAVSYNDYINRSMSLPSKYGNIAKAYVVNSNPLELSLYVLSYDSNNNLTQSNVTTKNNLKTYLSQYKSPGAILIKDAYVVNIGVNFDIYIRSGYNNREVLTECIQVVKDFFKISSININQPIILSELNSNILKINGVQSVAKLEVVNKNSGEYSIYEYDIKAATRNNIIYPSVSPCIFEIKYPDLDINGRIIWL